MSRPYLYLWLGGLVLFLCGLASGCGSGAPPMAQTPPPPVSVSRPVLREVVDFDDYEGRIKAAKTVEVRARVRGHIVKIHFKAGAIVKKNDLLYEIDPRPAKADLSAAKAQESAAEAALQFARAEYNRARMLLAKQATSREDVESWIAKEAISKADLLKAKAAVERAQLDLNYTSITAEMDGRISRTQVDEGNLVNAGGGETLLTTLVSIEPMYVYFDVDERSMIRYEKQSRKDAKANGPQPPIEELHIPVYVALEGERDYPHKGEIDYADNRINPSTGTIEVRGVLSNAERIFDDGMRARVRVPIGDPRKVVMIAERAVANDQKNKFVYVVDEQDTVQRRDVELGRVINGLQVIESGLKPDEWVIVNGIQRVREGMKVQLNRIPMPGAKQENPNSK
jgi:RND family efflux transporter MFP subunit